MNKNLDGCVYISILLSVIVFKNGRCVYSDIFCLLSYWHVHFLTRTQSKTCNLYIAELLQLKKIGSGGELLILPFLFGSERF